MVIRTMTPADYGAVHRLWRATPGMGLNTADDAEDGVARFLNRNPRTCFVAEEAGEIRGAILAGHDGRRGFIYHTAVAAQSRGRGAGTALVEAALAALKDEGIRKVALVAFRKNASGNAFWARRGFEARDDLIYRDRTLAPAVRIDT